MANGAPSSCAAAIPTPACPCEAGTSRRTSNCRQSIKDRRPHERPMSIALRRLGADQRCDAFRVVLMTFGFTIVGLNLAAMRLDPPLVVFLGGGLVCLLPGLLALALPAGGFGGVARTCRRGAAREAAEGDAIGGRSRRAGAFPLVRASRDQDENKRDVSRPNQAEAWRRARDELRDCESSEARSLSFPISIVYLRLAGEPPANGLYCEHSSSVCLRGFGSSRQVHHGAGCGDMRDRRRDGARSGAGAARRCWVGHRASRPRQSRLNGALRCSEAFPRV